MKRSTNLVTTKVLAVLIAQLLCIVLAHTVHAAYYVDNRATGCSNGSTSYNPSTRVCSGGADTVYLTLNAAEDAVPAGTQSSPRVINIRSGQEYSEKLDINKAWTTWRKYPGDTYRPVNSGQWSIVCNWVGLINIKATGVTVDGIEIKNTGHYPPVPPATVNEVRGYGIMVDTVDYATVKNCYTQFTGGAGIYLKTSNYALIEDNEVYEADYSHTEGTGKYWGAGIFSRTNCNHITIRRNYVHECGGEGMNLNQKGEDYLVEYNTVVDTLSAGIFPNQIKNVIVRYNLVYHTGNTRYSFSTRPPSNSGIAVTRESWNKDYDFFDIPVVYGTEIDVYGNIIAGYGFGLSIVAATDEGYQVTNTRFYNNTVIEPWISAINVARQKIKNLSSPSLCVIGSGVEIKNNIFWQSTSTSAILRIDSDATTATWSNNLWTKAPSTIARSATDPRYPTYGTLSISDYFLKTSGWGSLVVGGLTGQEFNLRATAEYAINQGVSLSSPRGTNFLKLELVDFKNRSFSSPVAQSSYGSWEIGADIYAGGVGSAPDTPSGLSVGITTQSTAALSWTESGGGPFNYYVKCCKTSEWGGGACSNIFSTSSTSYTLTTLESDNDGGVNYTVAVAAYNPYGASSYSTPITFNTEQLASEYLLDHEFASDKDGMTGWTESFEGGSVNWSYGSCSDNSDSYACKASRTLDPIPLEITIEIVRTSSNRPSTYAPGGGGLSATGDWIYWVSDNGTKKGKFFFADDGIWTMGNAGAVSLIPGTSSAVNTDSTKTLTFLIKQNPSGVFLVDIYDGATLLKTNVATGYANSGTNGYIDIAIVGNAANPSVSTINSLKISRGHTIPIAPSSHKSVYYAVDDCGDIKTGSPTVNISGGIVQFSEPQENVAIEAHGGKGFEISHGGTPTKCYVKNRISSTQFEAVTALGSACGDATSSTVNSFGPPFSSLSAVNTNVSGAAYLNGTNLVTLNVDVNLYLGPMTDSTYCDFDIFTNGDADNCYRIFADPNYHMQVANHTALVLTSNYGRFTGGIVEITSTNASSQKVLSIDVDDTKAANIEFSNMVLVCAPGNTQSTHEGFGSAVSAGADGSIIKLSNIVAYGCKGSSTASAFSFRDANIKYYGYRLTAVDSAIGFYALQSPNVVLKNCLSTATDPYKIASTGTFDGTNSTNNLSSSTDAPGQNPTNSATVSFRDPDNRDYHLHPVNDAVAGSAGIDLSEDLIIPIIKDLEGRTLVTPYSVGAYAKLNQYDLVSGLDVNRGGSITGFGPSYTFTLIPTYPVAGDSCVYTEGATTLYTDTGCDEAEVDITLGVGTHVIVLTASKSGWSNDTETITLVVTNSATTTYFGTGGGCATADPSTNGKPDFLIDENIPIVLCGTFATLDLSEQPVVPHTYDLSNWLGGTIIGGGHDFDVTTTPVGGPITFSGSWGVVNLKISASDLN